MNGEIGVGGADTRVFEYRRALSKALLPPLLHDGGVAVRGFVGAAARGYRIAEEGYPQRLVVFLDVFCGGKSRGKTRKVALIE